MQSLGEPADNRGSKPRERLLVYVVPASVAGTGFGIALRAELPLAGDRVGQLASATDALAPHAGAVGLRYQGFLLLTVHESSLIPTRSSVM